MNDNTNIDIINIIKSVKIRENVTPDYYLVTNIGLTKKNILSVIMCAQVLSLQNELIISSRPKDIYGRLITKENLFSVYLPVTLKDMEDKFWDTMSIISNKLIFANKEDLYVDYRRKH